MVCLFKHVWVFEKRGNISNTNFSSKNVLPSAFQKKNSANVTFLLHSIWSIQKLMHKTLACNVVLMFLMALSKAMQTNSFLPQVQIESSACGEKPSNINLPNKFYVAKPGWRRWKMFWFSISFHTFKAASHSPCNQSRGEISWRIFHHPQHKLHLPVPKRQRKWKTSRPQVSSFPVKAASHRAKKGDADHHRRGTKWVHLTASGDFHTPFWDEHHCSYL